MVPNTEEEEETQTQRQLVASQQEQKNCTNVRLCHCIRPARPSAIDKTQPRQGEFGQFGKIRLMQGRPGHLDVRLISPILSIVGGFRFRLLFLVNSCNITEVFR